MILVWGFLLIPLIATFVIPFLKFKGKAIAVYSVVSFIGILTSFVAINVLKGENFNLTLQGSIISGPIRLQVDALSAWFILIINFTFLTGGFYGLFYMSAYKNQPQNLTMQAILFVLLYQALLSLCAIQNSFVFIIAWEIMTLSAFLSLIFEHEKAATIKAGINFIIQSHVSLVFLMIGFIWVASQTGSYDFADIHNFAVTNAGTTSLWLFAVFLSDLPSKRALCHFTHGCLMHILLLRHIFRASCRVC